MTRLAAPVTALVLLAATSGCVAEDGTVGRSVPVPRDRGTYAGRPFFLRVHCGLSLPLELRGRSWLPIDPRLRRTYGPPEGFGGDDNYDRGSLLVVDRGTLLYTSSAGVEVEYEPTTRTGERCE